MKDQVYWSWGMFCCFIKPEPDKLYVGLGWFARSKELDGAGTKVC